jgi:fatty acyl-CoA reductase
MSDVVPYLEKQTFFVTGITGFLGKVLLIRLLTECKNLQEKSIIVLVRGKKELSAVDRFEKDIIQESIIFKSFIHSHPQVKKYFKVIEGDVSKSKLGLTPTDYEYVVNNTTCILHLAATTSFTENLKLAFETNVLGTQRVVTLAKSCKNITSIVYVSTCYTNSPRHGSEIREKVYPINFDPYEIINQVTTMTYDEADKATTHIIKDHPNTYTFSKMIAEHIVLNEKQNLPFAIVRPSIIGGSYRFPVPGWVDSPLGASGLIAACSLGALHCMCGGGNNIVDMIPVDFVADQILAAAWTMAENPPGERIQIYHAASSFRNPYCWEHLRSSVVGYYQRRPPKKNIARVWCLLISRPSMFYVFHFFFTQLPATVLDTKNFIKGQPPKMVAASKVLKKACLSLSFFTLHSWIFANHNTQALFDSLNEIDAKKFNFDVTQLNWELWCPLFFEGIKKYLFKEDLDLQEPIMKSKL